MLKRHEVEILLKAGHRKTEVARLAGVSLRSVKRIAQEGPVIHVDDAAERAQRQVGRPSTVANFRKPILEILQHTPDLASLEILRRVREAGYEGGKTALYALVASLRPKSAKPLVRFEGLHDEDPAAAILDRVQERGRFIHLDGPSGRTRHLNLEQVLPSKAERLRISGINGSEFPEPTLDLFPITALTFASPRPCPDTSEHAAWITKDAARIGVKRQS